MDNIEAVITKIQKLFALANSSNEHEAANAAAQARKLMDRYKIDMAQLESEGEEVFVDPIEAADIGESGRVDSWRKYIVNGVAKLNGCRLVYWHERKKVITRLFGRKSDIATANYTIQYLFREVEGLTEKAWEEGGRESGEHGKAWKNGFRVGCASRIFIRIKELIDERAKDLSQVTETALAVIQKHDTEVADAYQAYAKENRLISSKSSAPVLSSRAGFAAGDNAGRSVNLSGGKAGLPAAPGKIKGY